jgi:hypothetical protein
MSKSDRAVPAAAFKAKCLALLDEVAATRQRLIVTKAGPRRRAPRSGGLRRAAFDFRRGGGGSVLYLAPDTELLSTDAEWHATR